MALKDTFSKLINPQAGGEEEDYQDGVGADEFDDSQFDDNINMINQNNQGRAQMQQPQYAPQYAAPQYPQDQQGGADLSTNTEIKVVRPVRYDEVQQIADHLLINRTVVLNLEGTNKENARRMIDFLSGIAYSIGGNLRKVSNNTFVITPSNVNVTSEAQQAQVNPDSYNQATM
ncbi:MAG: cell division protein SepF [Clostridiales bacterium]|nr:cell division protein SepF [Clostridiales bacterium]